MQKERRINKRLLSYWKDLISNNMNGLPSEQDINPDNIDDIWDNCFLISFKNNKFKYDYLGKALIDIEKGSSQLSKAIYNELVNPDESNIISIVKEVITSKNSISQESEITNQYGMVVKYRRCFVPLTDEKGNVNYVLGGIRWSAA